MKRILFILLVTLPVLASAQKPGAGPAVKTEGVARPKLVIGIVVDQMRYDYIYKFWSKYGSGGFKKLVNEGFFCRNTNFNYVPTYTAPGHASVYSGTSPAVHGIIANDWYDRKSGRNMYCVWDSKVRGVGSENSEGKRSPANMLVTSITDELRLATNMKSKVIGLALKDRSAILPAGHTATGAYWFEGSVGAFISSTFYMNELPAWVQEFNGKKLAEKYLSEPWNTLLPIDQYTESLGDDNKYETVMKGETKPVFPHNLPEMRKLSGLGLIRTTPMGNTLTKDFAIAAMKGEQLGKGTSTDFLAVSFSSPDYIGHAYGPNSVEMEDCYIRLDRELAELIAAAEEQVGRGNALIFLTADHAAPEVPNYLIDQGVPAGYVNEWKLADTLKNYLRANYGDTLLSSYSNQQVFLNHAVIDQKKLVLQMVQEDIALFLKDFPGIAQVHTGWSMMNGEFTRPPASLVQQGFNSVRSGDVLVNYEPGYVDYQPTGTTHGSPYSYDTHVPLLFYGWGIRAGSTTEAVNITDIAPTLALLLNIQFPNGCTGKPVTAVTK